MITQSIQTTDDARLYTQLHPKDIEEVAAGRRRLYGYVSKDPFALPEDSIPYDFLLVDGFPFWVKRYR